MLKKTITFEDLDGNPITEEFHFNLSKAELTEMMFGKAGGLQEYVKKITAEEDNAKLMELFKELLVKAVGKRSADGVHFEKTPEIVNHFVQSDAYSELFIELATDAQAAIQFITGIVPSSMQDAIAKANPEDLQLPEGLIPATPTTTPPSTEPSEPAWLTEGRTPTADEVRNATPEQLRLAFARKQADNGEIAVDSSQPPLA